MSNKNTDLELTELKLRESYNTLIDIARDFGDEEEAARLEAELEERLKKMEEQKNRGGDIPAWLPVGICITVLAVIGLISVIVGRKKKG